MDKWLSSPPELSSAPELSSWPTAAQLAAPPAGDLGCGCGCAAALADVIAVIGDTRRLAHVAAGLLAAVLAGSATVTAALTTWGSARELGVVALLVPVVICWLATAGLVLRSEGPVTRALAELRHASGALVDPSAPWSPDGLQPPAGTAVTWGYVVSLIAAATHRQRRARVALGGAVGTVAVFLAWMAVALAATLA
jgi:hypothetical protein